MYTRDIARVTSVLRSWHNLVYCIVNIYSLNNFSLKSITVKKLSDRCARRIPGLHLGVKPSAQGFCSRFCCICSVFIFKRNVKVNLARPTFVTSAHAGSGWSALARPAFVTSAHAGSGWSAASIHCQLDAGCIRHLGIGAPAAFGTDDTGAVDQRQAQAEDAEDDDQLAHTTDPHEYNVEHEEWKPEDDARTQ